MWITHYRQTALVVVVVFAVWFAIHFGKVCPHAHRQSHWSDGHRARLIEQHDPLQVSFSNYIKQPNRMQALSAIPIINGAAITVTVCHYGSVDV